MAKSLNRVQLIGNLTRDPELRYTPNGKAVCTFGIATNRGWTTESGEKRDEVDFHKIVSWNKLAEICSQFLTKGRKVYVEGRLSTRSWTGQDGQQKSTTEVVIDDMILLDNRQSGGASHGASDQSSHDSGSEQQEDNEYGESAEEPKQKRAETKSSSKVTNDKDEVEPDDIPF